MDMNIVPQYQNSTHVSSMYFIPQNYTPYSNVLTCNIFYLSILYYLNRLFMSLNCIIVVFVFLPSPPRGWPYEWP